jgi:hypothetical protein
MKAIEINTKGWSDEQIKQATTKLEELGYYPMTVNGKTGFNGKLSISAFWTGEYCGYDKLHAWVTGDELSPTFEELMNFTKEDVQ